MSKLEALGLKFKRQFYILFGDTASSSILCLSLLLSFLFLGDRPGFDIQTKVPLPLFTIAMTLVGTLILLVIFKILRRLFPLFIRRSHVLVFLLIASAYYSYDLVNSVSSKGFVNSGDQWLLALLPVVLIFLLSLVLGAFYQKRKNIPLFILTIISFVGLGLYGSFIIPEGYGKPPVNRGEEMSKIKGQHEVQVLDFGPGEEIEFAPVNLMSQVTYRGWNKKIRDRVLGYTMSGVPLRGRIYLPKDVKRAPLLVFAHGNHIMVKDSYLGYDGLGEALASHGFAFVSVDHKMFNGFLGKGVGNENDGRAVLILDQVKALIEASQTPGHLLEGTIDPEKISVGGHSRGGEAAAVAALLNQRDLWSDNANFKLDYDFNLSGVISVSPTAHQYMPADHEVELKDINYLLIHGSHDADVSSFQGMEQYANISYTGQGDYFKSSVLVKGANHGQFNRMWGRKDKSFPQSLYLNTGDLLPAEAQEKVLDTYVLSFLESIYEGGSRSIFINPKLNPGLVNTDYYTQYQNNRTLLLADYEEDDDLTTASREGTFIEGEGLNTWREGGFSFPIGGRSRNHVVTLSGSSDSSYRLNIKDSIEPGDAISLDVTVNGNMGQPYLVVSGGGETAQVKLTSGRELLPNFKLGLLKTQHLRKDFENRTYLQTVILPVDLFLQDNPNLNLQEVDRIELKFEDYTQLIIDNFGIIKSNY